MRTQRRASRAISATRTGCVRVRRRWFLISGMPRTQRHRFVAAGPGITAPLMSIVWLAWVWLLSFDGSSMKAGDRVATDSLLLDCHNETRARCGSLSGSPPRGASPVNICRPAPQGGAGVREPSLSRHPHRSSFRHVSLLPVRTHIHPTLPIAPAARRGGRWAERHDGKRDLYFQHAA